MDNTQYYPQRTLPNAQNAKAPKVADFAPKSATGNAQSADAGNERETYDAR